MHGAPRRMATREMSVLEWLLEADPAIRWQVMRDLTDAPAEVVAAERMRVASHGWGARLLGQQRPDGNWGDGIATPHWRSNLFTLLTLRDLGLDPTSTQARTAVGLVRDQVTWGPEFGDSPFFEGEVEPCINGGVVALGGYFGQTSDRLVDRLLGEQLTDGGWNCEAERGSVRSSFHTTICVLEGLLEYEKARGATAAVTDARRPGTGVPARASPVPEVIVRRGDRAPVDAVHVSDHVALRRAEGAGLLAPGRRRTRRTVGRGRRDSGEAAKAGRAVAAP